MRKNKGFTLVELLVTFAILAIVLAGVTSIMVTGSKSFSKGNADATMQTQAQLVVNQIEDMVIDTNGGVYYETDDSTNDREFTLYNAYDAEDGSGTSYVKEVVKWVAAENKLYYSRWNVTYDASSGKYETIDPAEVLDALLAEEINDFSVDLSDTRKEYSKNGEAVQIVQSVQITAGYTGNNGQVSYATSPVITLRNRMMLSGSPKVIFDNTPVSPDTLKLYIADATTSRTPIVDRVTEVTRGNSYSIYAMINAQNDVNSLVDWKIEESGITSTINESGVLTVGDKEANAYLTIVATYKNNPNKYAKGVVKVVGGNLKSLDAVEIIPTKLEAFAPQYSSVVTTTGFTEEELATDLIYKWTVTPNGFVNTFTDSGKNLSLNISKDDNSYGKTLNIKLTVTSKSLGTSRDATVVYKIPDEGASGDSYLERGRQNSQVRCEFQAINGCGKYSGYTVNLCDSEGNILPDTDGILQYIKIQNPGGSGFGFDIVSGLPANKDYYVKVTIHNKSWNNNVDTYDYERIMYISKVSLYGVNKQVSWSGLGRYTAGIDYAMSGYYTVSWQSGQPYTLTVENIDYEAPEGVTVNVDFASTYMAEGSNLCRTEFTLSTNKSVVNADDIKVHSMKVKIKMNGYDDVFCYSTVTFTE